MSRTLIIALAVAVDVAVTSAIVVWVLRKRGLLGSIGADLPKIRAFGDSVRNLTGDYLRSNYGGDPESLPGVLDSLLSQLDQKAQEQGLTLRRDSLKKVLLRTIAAQSTVSARDAKAALKKVA
jgi:hypothetical protein